MDLEKVKEMIALDGSLAPYEEELKDRLRRYDGTKKRLLSAGQTLADFAQGHKYFGLHRTATGWVYREWAPNPNVKALHLVGDFNGWDHQSHPLKNNMDGTWEIEIDGVDTIPHLSKYKVAVTVNGSTTDRIPLYAQYVVQTVETRDFSACVYEPKDTFVWTDSDFKPQNNVPPLIYESHIGMATEEYKVGTYREFADNMLPRIVADGYNTVQLMAVMEHPYYGSFGYQVSNFFAASSRYGTPDDLKYMMNKAHAMGLTVLLDLVHSHAVMNFAEGINCFDGSVEQFFKSGDAGNHPAWGSKVFDYGRTGVLHFLLSNLRFWLEEYHFDGFRFDGVTSMLYHDHGLGKAFTGPELYFSMNTDVDAVTYLTLASDLIHSYKPGSICIAEDMSAMPGMCLPIEIGGIGFDYRLSMGIPDFYIKTLKEKEDGHWDMSRLFYELVIRRAGEKNIAYAESHDQALVGDKTLMFRMADAEMYTSMSRFTQSMVIDRAIALHKMIRLVTIGVGGEGYLNFMGNEFGHPEWIDFPREGNGWSHHYCRRQWSLESDTNLRYAWLGDFDKAMIRVIKENKVLAGGYANSLRQHEADQILVFEKAGLIFALNFHPTNSQTGLFIPAEKGSRWQAVLSTDDPSFGGFGQIDTQYVYDAVDNDPQFGPGFSVYLPARTAVVLKRVPDTKKKA